MVRVALFLAAIIFALGFSGCVSDSEPDSVQCSDSQVLHPFEARCLKGESGPKENERCNLWMGEGVRKDETYFCTASSDGKATAAVDFTGSGVVVVRLIDPNDEVVAEKQFGPGQSTLKGASDEGRWRLVVDFSKAEGPIVVDLWG